jgi:regulator of replication initiation timing
MSHSSHEAGVRLRRQVRAQLRDGKETVSLTAAEAELLLDEVGRLQQANDRLRRQNKRLRRRLLSQGGVEMSEIEAELDEVDAQSPDQDDSV